MFRTIKVGEKEIPVVAPASITDYYETVFHENPWSILQGDTAASGMEKMFFIMAKTAEFWKDDRPNRKRMRMLTLDDYLDWKEQFTSGDYAAALVDVGNFYAESTKPKSQEKKDSVR